MANLNFRAIDEREKANTLASDNSFPPSRFSTHLTQCQDSLPSVCYGQSALARNHCRSLTIRVVGWIGIRRYAGDLRSIGDDTCLLRHDPFSCSAPFKYSYFIIWDSSKAQSSTRRRLSPLFLSNYFTVTCLLAEPPRLLRTVIFCGFVGQEKSPR